MKKYREYGVEAFNHADTYSIDVRLLAINSLVLPAYNSVVNDTSFKIGGKGSNSYGTPKSWYSL